jgi:hypothetical protein
MVEFRCQSVFEFSCSYFYLKRYALIGSHHDDGGAAADLGAKVEACPNLLRTVLHDAQPEALLAQQLNGRNTATVISDL